MSTTVLSSGLSELDRAFGKRLAGDREGALRGALAILETSPEQLFACALVCRLLIEAKRKVDVGSLGKRLVDGFYRRGDLPSAAWIVCAVEAAGGSGASLFSMIADGFGDGARVSETASVAPPPLPKAITDEDVITQLSEEALFARAERALKHFMESADPVPDRTRVPSFPLFSALPPPLLARVLGALKARELADGEPAFRQGDEGKEAFVVVRGMLKAVRGEGDSEVVLAALGPGAIFGEMALVSDAPRAASVLAVEPAALLVIDRGALEALACKESRLAKVVSEFCRERMLGHLMRHSPVFAPLAPDARAQLMARFVSRSFEEGVSLVKQGEELSSMFLIASGSVRVTRQDPDGDRIEIAELGVGDVVGEISLVLRQPATADVTASYPTVALELAREAFEGAISAHPGLLSELYAIATRRQTETRSVLAQESLDVGDAVLL